ncbi:MAG: hypothetical protein JSS67_06235 [Bacteroidetes bacterium]|nr:hypothetical protein [Bacteroidota bacterium]
MKKIFFISFALIFFHVVLFAQTVIGECTLEYSVTSLNGNKNFSGTTKTFYLKGKLTRTDIRSANFSQTIIFNNATGNATIMKEIGSDKYITPLTPNQWKKENAQYEGMTFKETAESKVILGYNCIKALVTLKDGSSFSYYFTKDIIPLASENSYQFKDAGGFVLAYEAKGPGGSKIIFTATKINFDPVPASTFDIPSTGYRLLPYNQ